MNKELMGKVLNSHKNLIVEGDIGSGKTANVLFPIVDSAIDNKESLFIVDSKEEYLNKYYEKLKFNDYNIIILNLRDMDKSEGWNPLEYPYTLYKNGGEDKAQEYLEKIGKTIFYEKSTEDPFWSTSASDFFTGATLALFEDGDEEEINFNSVNSIFNENENRHNKMDFITLYFKTKPKISKSYIFASATAFAPTETKGGILSVAKQKLRMYVSNEKLSQILNKTTFSFDDVVNKPTAIFIIARDENKSFNALVSMFIEQLYAMLVDVKVNNKFNLILDNFDSIEMCNDLVDILSSCTARNIKTFIATRSIPELANLYGNYMLNLCDLLSIGNEKIKFNINHEEEIFEKDFDKVDYREGNVDYPRLKSTDIKIFNLLPIVVSNVDNKIDFLDKRRPGNRTGNSSNDMEGIIVNDDNELSVDADDLMKRIDNKINELNSEIANYNKNNANDK